MLTARPAADQVPDLSVTVTAEDLTATATDGGSVAFTDADGEVVGSAVTPQVWDAGVDAERQHPITEPWSAEDEGAGSVLAPAPAWSEEPASVSLPDGPSTDLDAVAAPPSPASIDSVDLPAVPAADPGQVESAETAASGSSAALPLPEAAQVISPDVVEVALTPDVGYLGDPETQYPVVVDPSYNFQYDFDTFVQNNIVNTDQSNSLELRIGNDGAGHVARSFLDWDVTGIARTHILDARLSLWEFHSYSCTPFAWSVQDSPLVGPGTVWGNQPTMVPGAWTSTDTKGYSSACAAGWSSVDVTGLVQKWASAGAGDVAMGLGAKEDDRLGWKKFNSSEANTGVPTLYVHWNTPPEAATGLTVSPSSAVSGLGTNSTHPRLSATVHDADGAANMLFLLCRSSGEEIWRATASNVQNGQVGFVDVPDGYVVDGGQYTFFIRSEDGIDWNTADSAVSPVFTVDTTGPGVPQVTSERYPSNGTWNGGSGIPGDFTLSMTSPDGSLAGYEWALDGPPATFVASSGAATFTATPTSDTVHSVSVRSVDRAGNRSGVFTYAFNVGRAGLVSPVEGAQVVRRVRLTATSQDPSLGYVAFSWRRGPDAPTSQPIALGALTRSDGTPLSSTWTSISALGDYAAWDAGSTLGQVPGPVQVRAVFATNSAGAGAYEGGWVTVTVSPDADGAAAEAVGPGTVNLLTGEYTLSATDVDEFGVGIGRTTSSRDPRSGFQPQAEMLTAPQQTMGPDVTAYAGQAATVTRATDRWHTAATALVRDSLRVASSGGTSDDFAYLPGVTLKRGGTYRVTGWIYVPAATGLSPDSGAGLRLMVFYQDSAGNWPNALSTAPVITEGWQQLTLTVTVPANAQVDGAVRLYNGFSAAGKEVFFDDLSVREIWAPLGPQWSLGTSDEVADTGYSYIAQPEPGVAALHLSGGGEIWFTQGGDRWWPEPGAEALTLKRTGVGRWELSELDGTISTFASAASGILEPNTTLASNQSLVSSSGKYRLSMQGDGNVVVYSPAGAVVWQSATSGNAGSYLSMQADGNLVVYSPVGAVVWQSATSGNAGSRLEMQNDGNLVIYRPNNSFVWATGTAGLNTIEDNAWLLTTSPPAINGKTRLLYSTINGRLRLTRMIAPVENGVDGWPINTAACTGATPTVGCEVVQLVYAGDDGAPGTAATPTAFGNYADRLVEIKLFSTAPGASTTDAIAAVRYAYDDAGRLREVWDPRITPALKTSYTYDADGRVLTITNPGELPWRFGYGTGGATSTLGSGDLVDRSSGRLLTVTRASLQPGSLTAAGPDTVSTVVYNVPLNRTAGGPYDLNAAALATWAQTRGPTDATAIFGPENRPTVTTATPTSPGTDGYKAATVHYLDVSAREVNTATPTGPDAPAGGYIDTAEYDQYGNVVRSLDATNRLLALGQMPSAAADLAALNLTQADTATRAMLLSSIRTYSRDGLDLLRTRGPLVRLSVGTPASVQLVHDVTTYVYDEGKPDFGSYHLVTTQTDSLMLTGTSPEQLVDVVVTVNGYNPIDGTPPLGPTSGWRTGTATTVTVDAGTGGLALTATVRYDATGRAVESRKVGATGTDAGTTRSVFYTAGPNTDNASCGNNLAYAGLPCMNYQAGPATDTNTTRMATNLPVRTVTGYNRYGSVTTVTESATGPIAGATVTQSRTTTTTYDAADRITAVTIAGTGTGVGTAVSRTTTTYDTASGDVTTISAVNPATGAVLSSTVKVFDALGRMTRYTDAGGAWTASVFDAYGKPTTVTDSLGTTTTFTYDRTVEPRGYVTSVNDSVAGTISATYGPDGQVTTQTLPGGVRLAIGYDANRTATSRTYSRISDGVTIAASAGLQNSAGQWMSLTTPASSKTYAYDRIRRLTDVRDTTTGINKCTARHYAYNNRAGRTSLASAASGTATCADPLNPGSTPVTTTGYTYDSADRLVTDTATGTAGWVYDPLGRITNAPVASSPGARVANTFYVNDLINVQTIAGVARQTWTLDPLQRFNTFTSETWMNAAWQQAVTKVNHYDSDSDSPAWIAEDASLPNEVTRYVDGLDGAMAMSTGKTGARVLQLIDLHGDVMTTVPILDGQTTADWTGLRHKTSDEFGNPTNLTTGGRVTSTGAAPARADRYGWLGGAQRSTDALAGVTLMGVRLYDPATGRFWSVDPVPGGNATPYDYCSGDPVSCTDLSGKWSWGGVLRVATQVADIASNIPGPIGAAAAATAAVGYAAQGQRGRAIEMAITAAASLVGAGAAVRAGARAIRAAGSAAARAGRSAVTTVRAARAGGEFRSTTALGREAHALFTQRVVLPRGGREGPWLRGSGGLRSGRPDGVNRAGNPMELKPHNARAMAQGRRQLERYETLMGRPKGSGELWTYRQSSSGRITFSRQMR